MRNLIEELQKLNNEEEYEVPNDFKNKVMSKIDKNSNNIIKLKYVIPMLSTAAVIMIVALLTTDGTLGYKFSRKDNNIMNAEHVDEEKKDYNMFDSMAIMSDFSYIESAVTNDATKEFESVPKYSKADFYTEIVDILTTNNVDAEIKDLSVRAKCTKEKAEEILFYYEGQITIEADGKYVIIK